MEFLQHIALNIIKMPDTDNRKRKIASKFQDIIYKFPGVIGCIRIYIKIRIPVTKIKSIYVNRHDYLSVCDTNKLFLNAFMDLLNKIHDARIFKLSFLIKRSANFIISCLCVNICIMNNDYLDVENKECNERHINNKQNPNDTMKDEINETLFVIY
ncbi:hypothetical protein ACFW04_003700 [Cataglyphis niger]